MREIFKPEDFMYDCKTIPGVMAKFVTDSIGLHEAARMANAKLHTLIESWPVVYGTSYEGHICNDWHFDPNDTDIEDRVTHIARLAFVEPLKPTPCPHTRVSLVASQRSGVVSGICDACGKEMRAEWKELAALSGADTRGKP